MSGPIAVFLALLERGRVALDGYIYSLTKTNQKSTQKQIMTQINFQHQKILSHSVLALQNLFIAIPLIVGPSCCSCTEERENPECFQLQFGGC